MLAPRRPPVAAPRTNAVVTIGVPSLGLDFSTPVSEMPSTSAVELDNFISSDNGLAIRKGWNTFASNIDGGMEIKTVMSFSADPSSALASPASGGKLFAVTDNGIFDITAGGDMTAATPVMALSGSSGAGRMSYTEFTNDGGKYLIACSEIDGGYIYTGATDTWFKMTSSGGPGVGIITGVNPAEFVQVVAWKRRLLFVQRSTTRMWSLPVLAVGGAASAFNFGPIFQHGGSLLALLNWTQDAGAGIDDRLVIISSNGDLAVYTGTDPTDANAFSLEGVWYIGQPPIGRRCFTESGGSPFILTQFGIVPVSQVVQGGLDNVLTSDTTLLVQLRKLQEQFRRDFETTIDTVGWEMLYIPKEALLLVKRPTTSVNSFIQYAFPLHTMGWSRMLDIPIATVSTWLGDAYAGTDDGRVIRVFNGYTDGADINGDNDYEIRARITPAFSYMGAPDRNKQVVMLRPSWLAAAPPQYAARMNTEFSVESTSDTPALASFTGSLWDSSFWDAAVWSGGSRGFAEWRSVGAIGYAVTATLFVSANVRTVLTAVSYMIKGGGPL